VAIYLNLAGYPFCLNSANDLRSARPLNYLILRDEWWGRARRYHLPLGWYHPAKVGGQATLWPYASIDRVERPQTAGMYMFTRSFWPGRAFSPRRTPNKGYRSSNTIKLRRTVLWNLDLYLAWGGAYRLQIDYCGWP